MSGATLLESYSSQPGPLAETVLSLPMHPYLGEEVQDLIIEAVRGYNG